MKKVLLAVALAASTLAVSVYQYRVTFKPDAIIPDINIRS